MKSGLEDRNNSKNLRVTKIITCPVSMKSGLEDRNNSIPWMSGRVWHEWSQ